MVRYLDNIRAVSGLCGDCNFHVQGLAIGAVCGGFMYLLYATGEAGAWAWWLAVTGRVLFVNSSCRIISRIIHGRRDAKRKR
jgi:hypothetical protein